MERRGRKEEDRKEERRKEKEQAETQNWTPLYRVPDSFSMHLGSCSWLSRC